MRYLVPVLILAIGLTPAYSQNGKGDKPPVVVFPELPTPPTPKPPQPPPGMPINLTPEMLYVVRSNVPCVMVVSPPGIIKVTKDVGPLRVRAKFIENPTIWQTKNYTEKFVYTVEADAVGKAELIVVPEGADDSGIIRKCFEVTLAPRPPPGPEPIPVPVPIPVDDELTKALKAAFALDMDKDKATQADSMAGLYKVVANNVKNAKYATSKEVMKALDDAEPGLGITGLRKTKDAIGVFLNAVLPKLPTAALTPADRDLIYMHFNHVASALGGLK